MISNLLSIFQLEQYDRRRFLAFAYSHLNWFQIQQRGSLDWTPRILLILLFTTTFFLADTAAVFWLSGSISLTVLFGILFLSALPLYIVVADFCLSPLYVWQKNKYIKKAQHHVQHQKKQGLKTIGITGSFGKTSMKNILLCVLEEKYSVFSFPGNINTDIGIAQYILSHTEELARSDILLVEMGAYKRGDIEKLCNITQPDYSILTSIGESHLDRFGSFENICRAKCELPNATKKASFLNASDANIQKYAPKYIHPEQNTEKYSGKILAENITFLPDCKGIRFEYRERIYTTSIIASYAIDFCILAIELCTALKMSPEDIQQGIIKTVPTPHRLQVIHNTASKRTVIDDSYNGNYAGFQEGIEVLQRAKGRKIILTPGIVELGKQRSQEVHTQLAHDYAQNIDLLLLIKNSNTEHIMHECTKIGYTDVIFYETATQAHEDLARILRNGDTILFQNDVTDNYL